MFTGIVEDIGEVTSKKKVGEGYRFKVRSKNLIEKLALSDSININGVCHTVTGKTKNEFEFTSIHETLKKTNIGKLNISDKVNLETSLTLNKKIGGHFVFGHIDDTGVITSIIQVKSKNRKTLGNWEYRIKINKKYLPFVIYVGSISINGVSLTIAEITKQKGNFFEIKVAIIPFTYKHTTFSKLKPNDRVNLEFDYLGKYFLNTIKLSPALKKLMKS